MNERKTTSDKLHISIYVLIAVFYFWLAAQVPYCHDDWDWGLDIGMHQFIYATVNCRYIGNFFEIIMTRSELCKTIIMGFCYFLIPYLISCIASKFVSNKTRTTRVTFFLISNLLLLTMDRGIWRQTYGWIAGFANFGISAVFMTFWIGTTLRMFDPSAQKRQPSALQYVFIFIVSVCSQLFIENLALYHTLLAIVLCILQYLRNRRIPLANWILLSGATIGMIIMFSSSLYGSLLSTGTALDGVRNIPLLKDISFFSAIYELCISFLHLTVNMYAQNYFLSAFILIMLSLLVTKHCQNRSIQKLLIALNLLLCALTAIGAIYDYSALNHQTSMYIFDFGVSAVYFGAVTFEIWLLFRDNKPLLAKLAALWLSAPAVVIPLIITTNVGPRLFFTSNIFIIFLALFIFEEVRGCFTCVSRKAILSCCMLLCAISLVFHGYVYTQIGNCKRERDSIIKNALESHSLEIALPAYPFSNFLHEPNPSNDLRVDFFKEFYGIPKDVYIIFEE